MAKPEEVIIIEDESGKIVREKLKNTQEIKKYEEMSKILKTLMHENSVLIIDIMTELLKKQTGSYGINVGPDEEIDQSHYASNKNWSFKLINSICWSIGSVYKCLDEDTESKFLVLVLRELLNMNEALHPPSSKAVVASDIMYLVGQYPRFLSNNWKFCQTVLSKLFEFMHGNFF